MSSTGPNSCADLRERTIQYLIVQVFLLDRSDNRRVYYDIFQRHDISAIETAGKSVRRSTGARLKRVHV